MKLCDLLEMAASSLSRVRSIFRSNFAKRHIELSLPAHASDRAVVGSRGDEVSEDYLIKALERFLKKFDSESGDIVDLFEKAKHTRSVEVTFRFEIEDTFLNFPTVIHWVSGDKFKFTIKTIMAKKDFKPHREDIVVNL